MRKELPYLLVSFFILVAVGGVVYFKKAFSLREDNKGNPPVTEISENNNSLPVVEDAAEGGGLEVRGLAEVPSNSLTPPTPEVSDPKDLPALKPLQEFTTPQGVRVAIFREGQGKPAARGDTLTVHYAGVLTDGTLFDSSLQKEPFTFTLGAGQVIPGWDFGIMGMKEGEIRRIVVPPQLAYGEKGVTDIIPPNAVLIFEIQLLRVQ